MSAGGASSASASRATDMSSAPALHAGFSQEACCDRGESPAVLVFFAGPFPRPASQKLKAAGKASDDRALLI